MIIEISRHFKHYVEFKILNNFVRHHSVKVTMQDMRKSLLDMMTAQQQWITKMDAKELLKCLPQSQQDLPIKAMQDSALEGYIPLSNASNERLKYLTPFVQVRFGRLLEDLDTFAVACCYKHNADSSLKLEDFRFPRAIWTVLVDRIDLRSEFRDVASDRDLKLSGHITWVGKSSMEATVKVEQEQLDGSLTELLTAIFVMVARNPISGSAALVCPLLATTSKEKDILANSQSMQQQRKKMSDESLLKTPPSEQEKLLIHQMFIDTLDPQASTFKVRVKPENSVWMEDAILKTCRICFPEQKNLYNKIFGGFLMRQAYELAWANACLYSHSRCFCVAVDDIVFRAPVSIGSFLFLSSQVGFTDGHRMQVRVHAEVKDPKSGACTSTNEFHFTFGTVDSAVVPAVLPKSYVESVIYLDSRRRFEEAMSMRPSPTL